MALESPDFDPNEILVVRTPRQNGIYLKILNFTKIHKNKDIEKNKSSYLQHFEGEIVIRVYFPKI